MCTGIAQPVAQRAIKAMNTKEYLELMRFPEEWQEWEMVPDEDYIADQIFHLKPGMEHTPEHARHEAFHYWLSREPSTEQLEKLAQLSLIDPDAEMGESIRAEIVKLDSCNDRLQKLIAEMAEG
jgi:hypothetical protein